MKRGAFILVAVLFLMIVPAAAVADAPYPTVFSSQVSLPSVYTGQSFPIYVNSTYGFYTYTTMLIFSGENLSGMINTFYEAPVGGNPDAVFNITAPSNPQTLTVLLLSTGGGNGTLLRYSKTFTIQVVSPIILNATVYNPTSSVMKNVTVTFGINNNNITTVIIPSIPAYGSQNVTTKSSYLFLLNRGKNTEQIYLNSPTATVNGLKGYYTHDFWYGPVPNYNWIFYIAAVVVVFMLFLVYSAGRRMPARRPKWRKK